MPVNSRLLSDREHLQRMFPIADVQSALLMKVKARCVFEAGAITADQLAEVDRRADETIRQSGTAPAECAA